MANNSLIDLMPDELKRKLWGPDGKRLPFSPQANVDESGRQKNIEQYIMNQELGATPRQEPVAPRRDINDYMRIQSAINKYESKQNSMPNLIRQLVGRSGALPSTGAASSADLKYIMGQTNEGIENEILSRQRSAIINGDINGTKDFRI